MKQTAELKRAQAEMQPGVITRDGLLGHDTRNLIDILEEDDAAVRRMGLTHAAIAARMQTFRKQGERGLGMDVPVAPHFSVRVDSVRGKLPCPFHHEGLYQKVNTTVRNTRLDREVTYTDLGVHMIAEHGFYEGRGAPFRNEPMTLRDILEVPPPDPVNVGDV